MIITAYSVVYFIITACSVALGMIGLFSAVYLLRRRGSVLSGEEKYELQKRVYLITGSVALAVSLRLALVPLWFFCLNSFIPHVPGAMCLTGVHMLKTPHSFIATGMKIFFPLYLLAWIVIHKIDYQTESRPLLPITLKMLLPLGLFIGIESWLDVSALTAVKPHHVSCCTALFDMPGEKVPALVASGNWFWFTGFCILTMILIGGAWTVFSRRTAAGACPGAFASWAGFVLAPAAIVFFFLAAHTKLSPIFLEAPYHHCVFCLWNNTSDGALFTGLIITGAWAVILFLLVCLLARRIPDCAPAAAPFIRRLPATGAALLTAGLSVILVHLGIVKLWS